jgi:multisubunit Na+/H+ antiporter MnhC subunit
MTALVLTGILVEVAILILTLKLWIDYNSVKAENRILRRDLQEVFTVYTSLVRQIKERKIK